jgi:ketosteroid isomerase-like protein
MPGPDTPLASGGRRPALDQVSLWAPALVDRSLSRLARLPPGSALRRQAVRRVLQNGFAALSRMDVEVAVLGYEPDCENVLFGAGGLGLADEYSGHQGWRELIRDVYDIFGEPLFTVKRVVDGGDRWVVEVDFVGRGKASGAQVVLRWGTVYRLSERGKIARQEYFWQSDGWARALEAAGLHE